MKIFQIHHSEVALGSVKTELPQKRIQFLFLEYIKQEEGFPTINKFVSWLIQHGHDVNAKEFFFDGNVYE